MKSRFKNFKIAPWMASVSIHAIVATLFMFSKTSSVVLSPLGDSLNENKLTYISLEEKTPAVQTPHVARVQPVEKIHENDVLTANKNVAQPQAQATTSTATTLGSAQGHAEAGALGTYLYGLRQLIQQSKIYPSLSKKMGETGKVIIVLELLKDGTIRDVKIKDASAFARLDQAALETVAKVEKYKPIPDAITAQQLSVEVPIQFSL